MKCITKKILLIAILASSSSLFSEEPVYTYYAELQNIELRLNSLIDELQDSNLIAYGSSNSLYRIRSDVNTLKSNLITLSNFLQTNQIEVSTSNIEDLLKGGYQSDWSVGESAYANYLATQDLRSYFQQGGDLRTLLNNLTSLQTIANNIDELDYLSNMNEDLDGIQDSNSKIQSILGGDYSASVLNDNILSNLRSLSSGSGIITNNIVDITRSIANTTNLLAQILLTVQTNRTSSVSSNQWDFTYLTTEDSGGFHEQFWELQANLHDQLFTLGEGDEFGGDGGFFYANLYRLNAISNLINRIYDDIHNTTNNIIKLSDDLHAITNSITAIPKKLDDWDIFYQNFTNTYNTTKLLYFDYDFGTPLKLGTKTIPQWGHVSFPDLIRYELSSSVNLLGSLNHYVAPLSDNATKYFNNATNLLTRIYNAVSTNDFAHNWWQYIDDNKSRFVLPMYRYHGSSGQTATTQNETINSDLFGFNRVFYNFLPNNLGSINNYLYDILNEQKEISDALSDIKIDINDLDFSKISLTNINEIAITNNLSITNILYVTNDFNAVTNSIYELQNNLTNILTEIDLNVSNFVSRVLDIDFSSPLSNYNEQNDGTIYNYLTNYYITVSTGHAQHYDTHTNWFNRVEMLLGAMVFGSSDKNSTNLVQKVEDSQVERLTSDIEDIVTNPDLDKPMDDISEASSSLVSVLSSFSSIFSGVQPPSQIVIDISSNSKKSFGDHDITISKTLDSTDNFFFDFVHTLTQFLWTILVIIASLIYIRYVVKIAVMLASICWSIVSHN